VCCPLCVLVGSVRLGTCAPQHSSHLLQRAQHTSATSRTSTTHLEHDTPRARHTPSTDTPRARHTSSHLEHGTPRARKHKPPPAASTARLEPPPEASTARLEATFRGGHDTPPGVAPPDRGHGTPPPPPRGPHAAEPVLNEAPVPQTMGRRVSAPGSPETHCQPKSTLGSRSRSASSWIRPRQAPRWP